jgi:hypothetical protein
MAAAVYILGALTSLACAVLLLRGYARGHRRLLLWSGLCFLVLAVSNVLVFVDLIAVPHRDLYRLRLVVAAFAMCLLLYGLIWEEN